MWGPPIRRAGQHPTQGRAEGCQTGKAGKGEGGPRPSGLWQEGAPPHKCLLFSVLCPWLLSTDCQQFIPGVGFRCLGRLQTRAAQGIHSTVRTAFSRYSDCDPRALSLRPGWGFRGMAAVHPSLALQEALCPLYRGRYECRDLAQATQLVCWDLV